MSTSTLIAYVVSWLSVIGIVFGFFSKLDGLFSKGKKDKLSEWLRSEKSDWPQTFASVFDQVFTNKHLSLRCLLRSVIASFASLIVVLLGWWLLAPEQLEDLFSTHALPSVFLMMVFLNLLPDYLSLLESRWFIQWVSKVQSGAFTLVMLLLDAVITLGIFVSFSWVIMKLFGTERLPDFQEYTRFSWEGLHFKQTIGVFVQTTFFTTIWIWLYILSGLIIKIVAPLREWLNIEQKPYQSLGAILVVVITIGYLIVLLFALSAS